MWLRFYVCSLKETQIQLITGEKRAPERVSLYYYHFGMIKSLSLSTNQIFPGGMEGSLIRIKLLLDELVRYRLHYHAAVATEAKRFEGK